jgi:hypothetical protein
MLLESVIAANVTHIAARERVPPESEPSISAQTKR